MGEPRADRPLDAPGRGSVRGKVVGVLAWRSRLVPTGLRVGAAKGRGHEAGGAGGVCRGRRLVPALQGRMEALRQGWERLAAHSQSRAGGWHLLPALGPPL